MTATPLTSDPAALALAAAIGAIPGVTTVQIQAPADPDLVVSYGYGPDCLVFAPYVGQGAAATSRFWYVSGVRWKNVSCHQLVVDEIRPWIEALISGAGTATAADLLRRDLTAACRVHVEQILEDKRGSLNTEAIRLQNKVITGGTLSTSEAADVVMLKSIQEWDYAMVDVREAAILSGTPISQVQWPLPPDGLAAFLQGY